MCLCLNLGVDDGVDGGAGAGGDDDDGGLMLKGDLFLWGLSIGVV